MKKIYLVILGIILLISFGVIYFINNNKQDEVLVSAINIYLERNKKIINEDTILITSVNNLKNENILDLSYENKILKITNKNKKIKYKVLDNYTFKKDNYYVLENNADNVNSKSFFYSDTNYRYYLNNAKNYFIKQNNVIIPLYDVINNNYIAVKELINVIPLTKFPNIPTSDNGDSKDNNNENKEDKENNKNDVTNNDNDKTSKPNNDNNSSNNNESGNNNLVNDNNDKEDSNNKVDIDIPNNEDVDIPNKNEQNKNEITVNNDFKIEDRTGKYCAQAIDEFWRDSTGIYYFTCKRSNNIYIIFKNGEEYLLKDALSKGKVTINELKEKGLGFLKKNIQLEER